MKIKNIKLQVAICCLISVFSLSSGQKSVVVIGKSSPGTSDRKAIEM